MIKQKIHVVPIFSLMLLEVLYFICAEYPKNLLNLSLLSDDVNVFELILTKVLLFSIEIFSIFLALNYNQLNDRNNSIKIICNGIGKIITFGVILRLVFDAISFVIPIEHVIMFQVMLDTLLSAFIFRKCYKRTSSNIVRWERKKIVCGTMIIIAVILYIILSLLYNQTVYYQNQNLTSKYALDFALHQANTYLFQNSLLILLYNCIIKTLMYLFCSVSNSISCESKNNLKITISTKVAQCLVIVIFCILFYVCKALLFPSGLLSKVTIDSSNTVYYNENKDFHAEHDDIKVYRINNAGIEECIYNKYVVNLFYGNQVVAEFQRDTQDESDDIIKIDENIYIYNTHAIMYLENNKPIVVVAEKIHSQEESQKLSESIKKLICLGYFDFLEYSYEYLLKYEPEFLREALERYSNGVYSNVQGNVKDEYITKFVTDMLLRDFS